MTGESNIPTRAAKSPELFTVNCLWVGPRLRPLEQVCLLSMLRAGHKVRLFSYGKVENVPDGVERAEAGDIIPANRLLWHRKRKSPALGTNVFRYKLMKRGLGLWLDSDVLLLKPIHATPSPLFGREHDTQINNAVLFLPPDDPTLRALLDFVASEHPIPPFERGWRRNPLILLKLLGMPVHVSRMRWGVFGPRALTYFTHSTGAAARAQPREVFYPVPPRHCHGPFMAQYDTKARLTDKTLGIHLWNEMLRRPSHLRPDNPKGKLIVEPGSFVEKFARRELGFALTSE